MNLENQKSKQSKVKISEEKPSKDVQRRKKKKKKKWELIITNTNQSFDDLHSKLMKMLRVSHKRIEKVMDICNFIVWIK